MYVWKINLKVTNRWGESSHLIYLGVASSAKVAINQTLCLAKRDNFRNRVIVSVEHLGNLDFSTKWGV